MSKKKSRKPAPERPSAGSAPRRPTKARPAQARSGAAAVTPDAALPVDDEEAVRSVTLSAVVEEVSLAALASAGSAARRSPPSPPGAPSAATRSQSVRGLVVEPSHASPSPADDGETERLVQELVTVARAQGEARFAARKEVGLGGVGSVSSVFDHVLKRRFAWKTLLDAARSQPVLVRSFLREAQITAALEHPNIVPVHDLGLDDHGRLFFTMKLVQGRTLSRLIADHHGDPDGRLGAVLDALFRVCDALAYAHTRGVFHCDIKPDNIMVADFGQVYLMDWGFAVVQPPRPGSSTAAEPIQPLPAPALQGIVFGTPAYMAPEQAHARYAEIDERTDVFSLGAVLYHALTGRAPYRGEDMRSTVLLAQRAAFRRLDAPDAIGGPYPKELVRIIHRAMAPAPRDRYPTVDELRRDLDHFVRGGATFPSRLVAAGEHVLQEGDVADAAYIITSGAVEVYKTVDGERVILGQLGPGDTFGEMALLAPAPRTASAIAKKETHLVVVTSAAVEQEMRTMKPWMGVFVRTLTQRFRDFQEAAVQGVRLRKWWQLW